jgi:hypothetical protein
MRMVAKFVMALVLFLMISNNIGYMDMVSNVPAAVVLAMICCLLPANGTIWIAAVVVLLDMYALSMETALVTFVLFAIIYFIYFRFAPTDGIAAVLTPIAFRFHIPYLMPVATGLLRPVYSIVSVICGSVLFYFFDGIHQNASTLKDVAVEDDGSSASKINVIVRQLTGNKEMFLTIVIFVLAFLFVYMVRRMNVDHAWTVAIAAGALFELAGLFAGYLIMNISGKMVALVLGSIVSVALGYGIKFFFMDLDYARTERVQFQDDEYFYYVKAVPKKMVASKEKTVKHFGSTGSMGKKIDHSKNNTSVPDEEVSRRVMAQELDIDEDLLK